MAQANTRCSYSHAAAAELGRYGITVNIVAPGPIQTGYIAAEVEPELVKRIPLARLGTAEDVAATIVLLASDQARWVTGQKVYVGGGNKMPLCWRKSGKCGDATLRYLTQQLGRRYQRAVVVRSRSSPAKLSSSPSSDARMLSPVVCDCRQGSDRELDHERSRF